MSANQNKTGRDPYEHFEPFDDKAALRNQIARTRADLGDTIEELAARTDVKARAKEMVTDVRSRAGQAVRSRARRVVSRTHGAARSSASSVRGGLGRASQRTARIAAGAGAGALVGYGIFELLRRRRAPRGRWHR
jgi:hypothetical protein